LWQEEALGADNKARGELIPTLQDSSSGRNTGEREERKGKK